MPKIDKSQFSKSEWKSIKEQRRYQKSLKKTLQEKIITEEERNSSKFNENKIAFVLGNGTSRQTIDLKNLRPHGTIYACNAIYREFVPDYLIAVDTKMIRELTANSYHLQNKVYTNPNRYTKEIPQLNLFNPNLGWSSGPSALNLAGEHSYKIIYILGFDYVGIGKNKEHVNNIYSGTINYKQKGDRATYYGNWSRQTATTIKKFPNTKYIRVIEDINSFVPDTLIGLTNLTHITLENFKKSFNLK